MRRTFILKVVVEGRIALRRDTGKIQRFLHLTRLINWQDKGLRVYLKVSNGKDKDHTGKLVEFYNDGWYENKEDFDLAYQAFIEV